MPVQGSNIRRDYKTGAPSPRSRADYSLQLFDLCLGRLPWIQGPELVFWNVNGNEELATAGRHRHCRRARLKKINESRRLGLT